MRMSAEKISAARGGLIAAPAGASKHATAAIRSRPPRALTLCMQHWRQLRAAIADPYRPERHYMRGAGPKWREKHATT
jgi:hypothetical protein